MIFCIDRNHSGESFYIYDGEEEETGKIDRECEGRKERERERERERKRGEKNQIKKLN